MMFLFDILIFIICLIFVVFWVFNMYMDSLPVKKQNEIHEKIKNWIANFWK